MGILQHMRLIYPYIDKVLPTPFRLQSLSLKYAALAGVLLGHAVWLVLHQQNWQFPLI